MKQRWWMGCAGAGVVALIGLAAMGVVRWRVHTYLDSGAHQPRLQAEDIALINDQIRRIDAAAPLEVCGSRRDAAELLNPMIGLDAPSPPPSASPWWAHPDVTAALKRDGSKWWDRIAEGPRGDLSVTRELLAYDHWTLPEADPGVFPTMPGWEVPTAKVFSLQTLAKLRLLEGFRSAALLPALVEVRHLASLLACGSNRMYDPMVALALLTFEVEAYHQGVERGLIGAGDWRPVPKSLIEEMRQLAWSFMIIEAGWVEPGVETPKPPVWLRGAAGVVVECGDRARLRRGAPARRV